MCVVLCAASKVLCAVCYVGCNLCCVHTYALQQCRPVPLLHMCCVLCAVCFDMCAVCYVCYEVCNVLFAVCVHCRCTMCAMCCVLFAPCYASGLVCSVSSAACACVLCAVCCVLCECRVCVDVRTASSPGHNSHLSVAYRATTFRHVATPERQRGAKSRRGDAQRDGARHRSSSTIR